MLLRITLNCLIFVMNSLQMLLVTCCYLHHLVLRSTRDHLEMGRAYPVSEGMPTSDVPVISAWFRANPARSYQQSIGSLYRLFLRAILPIIDLFISLDSLD